MQCHFTSTCMYKHSAPTVQEYYRDGDPFTEAIRRDQSIDDARHTIAQHMADGDMSGDVDFHYGDTSKFTDAQRTQLFWDNVDGVLTNGKAGMSIEQSFMASYDLHWEVVGEQNGNKIVEFYLTNASTLHSALPNPDKVKGSTYGNDKAGTGEDAYKGEWWTKQSVRWRETFPAGQAPQRPGAWTPTEYNRPSYYLKPLWTGIKWLTSVFSPW